LYSISWEGTARLAGARAFGHIAVITLMGLFILRKLGRIER
jgi:hypothetical protein